MAVNPGFQDRQIVYTVQKAFAGLSPTWGRKGVKLISIKQELNFRFSFTV
jgi:hypothetical protein